MRESEARLRLKQESPACTITPVAIAVNSCGLRKAPTAETLVRSSHLPHDVAADILMDQEGKHKHKNRLTAGFASTWDHRDGKS